MSRPVEPPADAAGTPAEAGRLADALHACLIPLVYHLPWRELAAPTQALLDQGADPSEPCPVTGRLGYSVLHEMAGASSAPAQQAFRVLLSYARSINATTATLGQTPLHRAVTGSGGLRNSLALLRQGADPNQADGRGYRPLLMAVRLHSPGHVAALLRAGANPHARIGDAGLSLLYEALRNEVCQHNAPNFEQEHNLHAIIGLLLAHGADPEAPFQLANTPRSTAVYDNFASWRDANKGHEGMTLVEQARRREGAHRLKLSLPAVLLHAPVRPRM